VTPARSTGVGSLPGTDPVEAARVVLGELPDLPHLPELPARGPHADLGGRGAALLVDLPVDLQPSGWRLVPRPSRDGRRARDLLRRDLDALEEVAADVGVPPAVKLQATGPWTLAALLELPRGERVLSDPAAVDDLSASLADGVREHLDEVGRRLPGAQVVLQLDEPSLPAVLAAQVPDASGAGRLRAPDAARASQVLERVLAAHPGTVVHCCAPHPPVPLLRRAGAAAVSLDALLVTPDDDEPLGEAVEAGTRLLLGVVPATGPPPGPEKELLAPVVALWRRLGLDLAAVADAVTLTPSCGLAGASPDRARAVLAAVRAAGERLDDLA
jgi:methionine synthase II (cobalamin-independent)